MTSKHRFAERRPPVGARPPNISTQPNTFSFHFSLSASLYLSPSFSLRRCCQKPPIREPHAPTQRIFTKAQKNCFEEEKTEVGSQL
jgi:hypothetical protein